MRNFFSVAAIQVKGNRMCHLGALLKGFFFDRSFTMNKRTAPIAPRGEDILKQKSRK
jgi:hypothetical protein